MKNVSFSGIAQIIFACCLTASLPAFAKSSPFPTFLETAKDADGYVLYMNIIEARQYCLNQGGHLPSARELAHLPLNLGAKGFAEIESGWPGSSYRKIDVKNADGSLDNFYFSSEGYQRPVGDLGGGWIWSSSVVSSNHFYYVVFYGYAGTLETGDYRYEKYGVRCVSDR